MNDDHSTSRADPTPKLPPALTVSTTDDGTKLGTHEDPNAWLLEYLDVAHVRPIVEAMDIDGSGFISVEELNIFARSRPKQWRFVLQYHLTVTSF